MGAFNMIFTSSMAALIAAVIGIGFAVRWVNNPRLPNWLRDDFIGAFFTPILTGLIAVGLGGIGYTLFQWTQVTGALRHMDTLYGAALSAVLCVLLFVSPVRRFIFGRKKSASTSTSTPTAPSTLPPSTPPGRTQRPVDSYRSAA